MLLTRQEYSKNLTTEDTEILKRLTTEDTKNLRRQRAKGIKLKVEKQLISLCFQWLKKEPSPFLFFV